MNGEVWLNGCRDDFGEVIVGGVMFGVKMGVVEGRIEVVDIGIGLER